MKNEKRKIEILYLCVAFKQKVNGKWSMPFLSLFLLFLKQKRQWISSPLTHHIAAILSTTKDEVKHQCGRKNGEKNSPQSFFLFLPVKMKMDKKARLRRKKERKERFRK
jgi:hypothetical protein